MDASIALRINGKSKTISTDPERPLLDVLREDLGLTGTKYGCGEGQCCACSVLVDGERLRSCITPVSKVEGKAIVTIEGRLTDAAILFNVDDDFEEDVEPVRNLFSRFYHKGELIGPTLDLLRTIPEIDALNIDGEEVSRN